MSTIPPQLPHARPTLAPGAPPRFLAPLAQSVLVVCAASALSWLLLVPLAASASSAEWVRQMVQGHDLSWLSPALHWLGAHAVAVSVAGLLTCLAGVAACWGMLRRQGWALWLFIVLLVATAASNFAATWVIDDAVRHLLAYLAPHADASDMRELRLQRLFFTGTALGTSVAFAVLHVWLVVRLLRADVLAYFRR